MEMGEISSITFGLLSAKEIRELSVVEVWDTSLYFRNYPRPHGANDLRMGTTDRRLHCATCKNDMIKCSGHIGHIELALPVYHTGFISIIVKILRCVCFSCCRLLVLPNDPKLAEVNALFLEEKLRLTYISNVVCKTKNVCPYARRPLLDEDGNVVMEEVEERILADTNTCYRDCIDGCETACDCECNKCVNKLNESTAIDCECDDCFKKNPWVS